MTEAPVILLNGIGCSNMLASEFQHAPGEDSLMIHAVSSHGELFIIRGARSAASGNRVKFQLSALPIPIRTSIRNITSKFNPTNRSYEIVYVDNDMDTLRQLIQDPETGFWREFDLIVKSAKANKTTRTRAFLMTVTLSNGKGSRVPAGYMVRLSSAPTLAFINDRSYNLTRRPQTVAVNAFGQLQIAIPAPESLGAEPVNINFMADTNDAETYKVQPAQRILYNLSQLKTSSALKNAKTYDGRALFSEEQKTKNAEHFDQAAACFAELPNMLGAVNSKDGNAGAGGDQHEITVAWQRDEKVSTRTNSGWFYDAVDAVGEALGDVIEFLKKAVKGIVKVALRILGPVIRLVIKIGAKVIRFVLNTVSAIATGLLSFLESAFGVDLSFIKDWFTFRFQKVEATQKVWPKSDNCRKNALTAMTGTCRSHQWWSKSHYSLLAPQPRSHGTEPECFRKDPGELYHQALYSRADA